MLEEGSKPRAPGDSREGAAPENATRTGRSWVSSPWLAVAGSFLVLLALGADAGLVAGLLLGMDRDDFWHLESGLAALVLADGIVAGAVLGRRLLAGSFRAPEAPPSPSVAAVHVEPGALIPFDGFVI